MSHQRLRDLLRTQLDDLKAKGLYKRERQLQGPQGAAIKVADREVVNFCANNYLGLANHPDIVAAARDGLQRYGYGMASVRFICGTQEIHKQLRASRRPFPRQGRRHSLQLLLGRQRRALRNHPRRRRRRHQRRAQSRQHHRRRAALQGEALPLQELRCRRPGTLPAWKRRTPACA